MISMPLFRREARRSILLLVIFAGILALYASVILTMYDPELGDSLAMMKDAMPELFAAFGMSDPGSTLTEFLANYLYGFLFLVLPLVLLILLTNRLVVGYLDRGTMAWLLSTPTPRWKIAATQAMLHVVCAALIVVYAGGLCVILSAIMYPGELAVGPFFRLNLTLAALLCLLGSICFLGACALPDSRRGLALGGGLCVMFLLLQMLAQSGEKWEWLRYLTPLTAFHSAALSSGGGSLRPALGLAVGTAALYAAGIWRFTRRDLSL